MIKIELNKNGAVRLNVEPFLLSANEALKFDFISNYDLTNSIITLKNGKVVDNYKLSERIFRVPDKFLFAGQLFVSVKAYQDGKVYKS